MSKALTLYGGEAAQETALFVDIFDKFFDCLNVRNFTDGKRQRKVFQNPYRSGKDFRLKVYLQYMHALFKLFNFSGWRTHS